MSLPKPLSLNRMKLSGNILPTRRNSLVIPSGKSNGLLLAKTSKSSLSSPYAAKLHPLDVIKRNNSNDGESNQEKCQSIKICFLKNWGDPKEISLSEISFLDSTHTRILNIGYSTDSKKTRPDLIPNLFNGVMCKTKLEECWVTSWNPEEPFELSFCIDNLTPVTQIRLFNSEIQGDTAAKEVEIIMGQKMMWKGDLSRDFGVVATLDDTKFEEFKCVYLSTIAKNDNGFCRNDKFGRIPVFKTKNIRFKLLLFENNSIFMLSRITFLDFNNNAISKSKYEIQITHSSYDGDKESIFGDSDSPAKPEGTYCIKRKDPDTLPTIHCHFADPCVIGSILIQGSLNTPTNSDEQKYQGIEISNNRMIFWVGPILPKSFTQVHLNEGCQKRLDSVIFQTQ